MKHAFSVMVRPQWVLVECVDRWNTHTHQTPPPATHTPPTPHTHTHTHTQAPPLSPSLKGRSLLEDLTSRPANAPDELNWHPCWPREELGFKEIDEGYGKFVEEKETGEWWKVICRSKNQDKMNHGMCLWGHKRRKIDLCWPFWPTSQVNAIAAAAAAKSPQSCPTLCNPIDSSPPGSPVPGILQARTLEWVAISFSNAWKWKVKVKALSCVQLCATP